MCCGCALAGAGNLVASERSPGRALASLTEVRVFSCAVYQLWCASVLEVLYLLGRPVSQVARGVSLNQRGPLFLCLALCLFSLWLLLLCCFMSTAV